MGRETSTTPATALAPGFRFHPTDEELVRYYLKRKVCGKSLRFDAIAEIDIYKSQPWELPGMSRLKSGDQEWYFFTAQDKKYGNGSRINRATSKGYWKATGNDRAVRHDMRTVGMKKTLVFYKGRAPVGKRTNWVMHEYRLTDEELEKSGVVQDVYVLCKVFHKNDLGSPTGVRCAPCVEDEWDDDHSVLDLGTEAVDGVVAGDDARHEGNDLEQNTESNTSPRHQSEHSRDSHNVSFVCKSERLDDSPWTSTDDPKPFQIVQNKRLRLNGPELSHSNASENLTTTTQDPSLSATKKISLSGVMEFPLLESVEPKESPPVPAQRFDIAALGVSVPPAFLEFINNLQKQIHSISIERETLKIEMMSAQAMINILQSRIEFLNKENEDLKRTVRDS